MPSIDEKSVEGRLCKYVNTNLQITIECNGVLATISDQLWCSRLTCLSFLNESCRYFKKSPYMLCLPSMRKVDSLALVRLHLACCTYMHMLSYRKSHLKAADVFRQKVVILSVKLV